MSAIKTTLRKKEKKNYKTGQVYYELVGFVENGKTERIGVSIPCDERGNVTTYESEKYQNDFIYATVFKFKEGQTKKSRRSL